MNRSEGSTVNYTNSYRARSPTTMSRLEHSSVIDPDRALTADNDDWPNKNDKQAMVPLPPDFSPGECFAERNECDWPTVILVSSKLATRHVVVLGFVLV